MKPTPLILFSLATARLAVAAPTYSTVGGPGVTTDLFDTSQGAVVIQNTPILPFGGEDIREAFGASGGVESGNAIFDGGTAGFTDSVSWQTADFVTLSGIELRFAQDGVDANRSIASYELYASQDGVNFNVISSGSVPLTGGPGSTMANNPLLITDNALTGTTTNIRGYRLDIIRNTMGGPRFVEADGFGSAGIITTTYLDPIAFNATSNTAYTGQVGDDQAPGLSSGFSTSPTLGGDDPEGAFGNANGAIEPESVIFADGATVDNGNMILGDGGEFVDFLEWTTSSPLTLAGFRIGLSGDGGSPTRGTELVRFLVEGTEVDLFDNNAFGGDVTRLFGGGPVIGNDFRIEFTRTEGAGGRIFEIDAILGVVPEPSSALLGMLGGFLFLLRRRR